MLDCEFAAEESSFIGGADGSFDFCLNISDVGLIDNHFDA